MYLGSAAANDGSAKELFHTSGRRFATAGKASRESRRTYAHVRLAKPDLDGLQVLLHERLREMRSALLAKRCMDVAVSALLLVLLSPLLLAVAALIRIDSPGPATFAQPRHGRGRKPFQVYKFRTMYINQCDRAGTIQAVAGDLRVTRIGRLLRRYSIDELPQLWNVLKGDMSLVGPRPHPIGMFAGGLPYEDLVPAYHLRHLVRPGVTGLAQVRGLRGPTLDPKVARMRVVSDVAYVMRFSMMLDLLILVRTVVIELRNARGF
jgi:lipopolysaccharide/colanic/teichoic acid biosynthesis glycosyltransferase